MRLRYETINFLIDLKQRVVLKCNTENERKENQDEKDVESDIGNEE